MPAKKGNKLTGKLIWTDTDISFIRENFEQLSIVQLATLMGVKVHSMRIKCYAMGLKKMEMEYWTKRQVNFLVRNYTKYGDKELAEIFNRKWEKKKPWTLKHIEKKRKYLNIKRTPAQLLAIKEKHKKKGAYAIGNKKMWKTRGVSPEGSIRYWKTSAGKPVPYIKVNGKFIQWARQEWMKYYGKIPKRKNIVFKDHNPYHLHVDNLEMISDSELAKRNSKISSVGLSDNYIIGMLTHKNPLVRPDLKGHPIVELKRQSLILNRTIYEQISNQAV